MAERRAAGQQALPIQPVSKPILCSPYQEPDRHWFYEPGTGSATIVPGRRPASYWYQTKRTGSATLDLFAEEQRDDLPLVNALRQDVRRWRQSGYPGSTTVTRQLLAHWTREDRPRRLFFCQTEAVETIIYLSEVLRSGGKVLGKPAVTAADFDLLMRGASPSFLQDVPHSVFPRLIDPPNEAGFDPLVRFGCKMATGSGKTVVMAMLVAWAFCNRGRRPTDGRFPGGVLVVCPNLTHPGAVAGTPPRTGGQLLRGVRHRPFRPVAGDSQGEGAGGELAWVRTRIATRRRREDVHRGEQGCRNS